ncbi:nitrite/sulfite reductase [Fodinisporobacter ferrooxydans]|uniref:Nitrite/sulfite reductase n=1 Tax=Fodinisporobacter ferrooxydans TaxID=2901836 RepID=A0ABY4CR88_9BACL|nr:nitrite/sulfite reductase [Alicyclobacillaceae bacterium MYW30-H2]
MATYTKVWAEDTSKLNKLELAKLEKDGLDVIADVYRYANLGFDAITPDDMDRFKWAGIYQQKPKTGHFMMRVRIHSGVLSTKQARAIAGISRDYGRNLIDVTTRQAVQFHWLQIQDMPDIFGRLAAVGLSSFEACGDCPRTFIGNPLAGIDPDELMDTRPLIEELSKALHLNREFSNLPRKYKVSLSANVYNTSHAEINDLAFVPATKEIDGEEVVGFHILVGGGLSTKPHLALPIDIFVRPEDVVKVALGVTTIFRDYGYREKRTHARFKFLVADWGADTFLEKLTEIIGPMPSRGVDQGKGWNAGYFTGVHPQKQEGLSYIGLSIQVGRLSAEELFELADLADRYGNGELRTCNSQNIILPNIPNEKIDEVLAEPLLKRLTPFPKLFAGHVISCTGNEFCNLAVTETKERMKAISNYLDEHVELDTPVRIHVNGCPNSCGQQQIADIGLQGALVKKPDGVRDAFDIFVGGTLGPDARFNTKLKGRVEGDLVGPVLERLILFYKTERTPNELFYQFVARVGIPAMQQKLDQAIAEVAEVQEVAAGKE